MQLAQHNRQVLIQKVIVIREWSHRQQINVYYHQSVTLIHDKIGLLKEMMTFLPLSCKMIGGIMFSATKSIPPMFFLHVLNRRLADQEKNGYLFWQTAFSSLDQINQHPFCGTVPIEGGLWEKRKEDLRQDVWEFE